MGTNSDSSKSSSKMKKDWYQTDSHVIITIFIKGVECKDHLNITFQEKSVSVEIKSPNNSDFIANFDLWHYIRPEDCSYKVFATKIEIKLKKKEGLRWESLEGDGPDLKVKPITASGGSSCLPLPNYPSSALKKHDWNKLEAEVKREEETEKPEGDAALNQLFQKLYSDGDEEVKRAMNKSFMESGGTVLSTNWKEVGTKRVDIQAPDGMEYKKWDQ